VLDVCSNQGAKREMWGHIFQMGGRAPLPPTAGDVPDSRNMTFSDSSDPVFNSRDTNRVPKTP